MKADHNFTEEPSLVHSWFKNFTTISFFHPVKVKRFSQSMRTAELFHVSLCVILLLFYSQISS